MTTNDGIMNNTTLPASASASAVRSSASVRSSTIVTLKLNQGRIYDCGRVPPIPKQLQRKQKQKQQQQQNQQFRGEKNLSSLSTMTTTSESSSDKDEDPVDIKYDGDGGDDNTSALLHYLISSHTNKRRGRFSKSGWLRRIVRGQIRIEIVGSFIIMTNPCYKILTKDNVKQQVEYYRRPWYEPIIQVKVALLLDDVDVENKRIINHNNNNNNIDDDDIITELFLQCSFLLLSLSLSLSFSSLLLYNRLKVLRTEYS